MTPESKAAKALGGATFALLVATVFGHLWFASTPLPLGGPNIVLAVAASLTAACLWIALAVSALRAGGARRGARLLPGRSVPAALAFVVAALMWAWVLAVYLRTGTFNDMRMGQLTVGVGVLFALLVCVDSARRARWLLLALIVATAVSALLGLAVLVVGDPFLGVWLRLAAVAQTDLETILIFGRSAGGAVHPSTLGYQMAVAIPLGFCALVHGVYGRGRRAGVVMDVVLFVLVTVMLATLLVNGSRSTTIGVCVGLGVCAVGTLLVPAWRQGARRLAVVAPLVAGAQAALFNPWFNLGDIVEELHPVRAKTGDIDNLVAGGDALASDDPSVLGHRFGGHSPGVAYRVQLRQRFGSGYGQPSQAAVVADAEGGFVLTWRQPAGRRVERYEVRLRQVRQNWSRWAIFAPALRGRAAALARHEVAFGDHALAAEEDAVVGAEVRHLAPRQEYVLQLRAVLPDAFTPPSEARGRADADGAVVFTWRIVVPNAAYQCRLRLSAEARWPPWRACEPSLPRALAWSQLKAGSETLGLDTSAAAERTGHQFDGFRSWKWYVTQVRETFAPGVERVARHGEVVVQPDLRGSFVLTWPAPAVPEGVAGYQFRSREVGRGQWLPWRGFSPSLSSRAPFLRASPAGWPVLDDDRLVRHTLLGLPPTLEHAAQVRARTPHGFGAESDTVQVLADEDRSGVLAWWRPSAAAQVTGYQFRLWWVANKRWRPWQDLTPPFAHGHTNADMLSSARRRDRILAAARNAQGVAGALRPQPRTLRANNLSARSRWPQVLLALRHARANPFGTGEYLPLREHADEGLSKAVLEEILRLWPHNQFLHVLVLFGAPGLALQLVFYGVLGWAAWRAGRLAWRERRVQARFVVVAVLAAWAAYSVNSLFFPTGPFIQDWGHFFVLGLLLGLERIVAGGPANASPATAGAMRQ